MSKTESFPLNPTELEVEEILTAAIEVESELKLKLSPLKNKKKKINKKIKKI